MKSSILIIDFGSQLTKLIARRIRELGVFSEIVGFDKINKNYFKNDFEILSVLRNLKIIGIFTRLAIRDNKKKYLKMIPLAWKLIEGRINNNIIFYNLKNYLDNNISTKCRMKK